MRTADAIVRLLIENEVEVVFGVPGDTSMPFHNAFEKFKNEIKYVACRDERHATYMADTYARMTGKPGVADVPSGGGLLYAVPGLSEATASSVPIIVFSSDITLSSEGTGALTELKQVELTNVITKWNTRITLASKVPEIIRKAFRTATSGRPGAVHISVPEDIHEQEYNFKEEDFYPLKQKRFKSAPLKEDVQEVVKMFLQSKQPVVLAGGGVHLSQAYEELTRLSSSLSIPVVTTINGKGSISESSPLAIGVIGVNGGTEDTNNVVKEADFVLVLGSKLNNVTTVAKSLFNKTQTIVQVDISEENLDLNIRTDFAIQCDIQSFITCFLELLHKQGSYIPNGEWISTVRSTREKTNNRIELEVSEKTKHVNPARIVNWLDKHAPKDSLFVVDAGTQNPYMAANFKIENAGKQIVFDRGHGNLGYALGASIGAQFAQPKAKVFTLFGDGSFAMSVGELETAVRQNLPIVFILLQNNSYGWIKKLHQLYYDEQYIAVDFTEIDAAKIAEGFGVKARKVETNEQLETAFEWAVAQNSPVFLDISIERITDIVPPVTNWRTDSNKDPKERVVLTY
ncbi:thiamine pyrophosphate-binding protein [Psychrobacillus sp. NPDC093180]|uniref:thiamine pyrophosphate-binding protein n=1 Tax=Psychrobacillus sp. NPDC093180 TaxID=3364489 RepID=UPI00380625DA